MKNTISDNLRHPLRILIADDETLARERLRILLEDIQKTHPTEIIGEAADGEATLTLCAQHTADLLILDFRMHTVDGLEVALRLLTHTSLNHLALLFTTAYRDHACDAFEVDAIDYLVKPVRRDRLAHALDKVYAKQKPSFPTLSTNTTARFAIPGRQHTQWIDFDRLLYFKAEHKYTTVVTRDGEHLIEISLTELEVREHLLRIHRKCVILRQQLVELRHTTAGWYIRLRHWPPLLEVSRRQLPLIRAILLDKTNSHFE